MRGLDLRRHELTAKRSSLKRCPSHATFAEVSLFSVHLLNTLSLLGRHIERKLKCSGETPCSQCNRRKHGAPCSYDEAPRRRGPGKKNKGAILAGQLMPVSRRMYLMQRQLQHQNRIQEVGFQMYRHPSEVQHESSESPTAFSYTHPQHGYAPDSSQSQGQPQQAPPHLNRGPANPEIGDDGRPSHFGQFNNSWPARGSYTYPVANPANTAGQMYEPYRSGGRPAERYAKPQEGVMRGPEQLAPYSGDGRRPNERPTVPMGFGI
jgi:hypothetical protein